MRAVAIVAIMAVMVLPAASLALDAEAAKNRPITKVITLLKDMQKQLIKEGEEDQEVYDQTACWCTTNDQAKTKAIADAESKINTLEDRIEELTALSVRLNTEIGNLESEKKANEDALQKATDIREKELKEFNAEEKDLLESIAALGDAITVLGTHQQTSSFLQMPSTHVRSVAATLQHELHKHHELLQGVLTHSQRRMVMAFVQQPAPFKSYNPQSNQIFGVLTQMKETFENNLAASQKTEMAAQQAYESLKDGKLRQIAVAAESIATKTAELADTDEKNAVAKEDLADTNASMSADMKYLVNLKEKCALTDKEMQERLKTRQLEIQAVSKAMAILSSEDAQDLATRTFNSAFVQTRSQEDGALRKQASQLLKAAAQKLNNPMLATLAQRVRLDAFTKVKQAIDDMITHLLAEKEAEVKHKDFCVDEFSANRLQTEKKDRQKSDLEAHIEDLTMTIDTLTKEINTLEAEIADLQLQLKRAGENREKASKEFQLTVADQRATNKLVEAALTVLEGFYGKAAFLHLGVRQEPVGPPPPAGFKTYEKNKTSGGVMGMMRQIIEDAKAMEAESIKGEEDAQAAYESLVKDTNASIMSKQKELLDKRAVRAKTEEEKVQAETDLDSVNGELDELANYKAELHRSCDYVLQNFDTRQTARDEEVEALKQAKAILSGAKFSALLQG